MTPNQPIQPPATGATFLAYLPHIMSAIAMALSLYTRASDRSAEQTAAFNNLDKQVAVMRSQVDTLLAASLQRAWDSAMVLHRPEPKFARRDQLLEGWRKHDLSADDKAELAGILTSLLHDTNEPDAVRTLSAEILRAMEQEHRDQPGEPKSIR